MRVPFAVPTFFFYVLWLLAVPMEGPLLTNSTAAGCSLYFLMMHVPMLAIIGRWASPAGLRRAARIGAVITALLTLLLFQAGGSAALFMAALGIAAAPITVKTCIDLHSSRHPALAAAWSLVGANVLLGFIQTTSSMLVWTKLAILLPLLTLPKLAFFEEAGDRSLPLCRSYLVFVFIFQVVSGLMYAVLFPAYAEHVFILGLELPFYMTAALSAVVIFRHDRDLLPAIGLTLAMVAFALLQIGGAVAVNFGFFAMQAAAGCVDMFLLSLLLTSARSLTTFGYGLAVLCGGIAAGQFLSLALGSAAAMSGLAGSLVLNAAALALFLRKHRHPPLLPAPVTEGVPSVLSDLPAHVVCQLSEQEIRVLTMVSLGKNYRETALELHISESSVKTYMKRICDKLGVSNRVDLLRYLSECRHIDK